MSQRPAHIGAALLILAAAAPALAGCGSSDEAASVGAGSGPAPTATPAASPLVCSTSAPADKHLPASGSQVIRSFVRAMNAGRHDLARAYLAPDEAGEVLAGLAQVRRLRIVDLQDRY